MESAQPTQFAENPVSRHGKHKPGTERVTIPMPRNVRLILEEMAAEKGIPLVPFLRQRLTLTAHKRRIAKLSSSHA